MMSAIIMAVSCDPHIVSEEQKSLAEVLNTIDMDKLSSDVTGSFFDFLDGNAAEDSAVYLKDAAINGNSITSETELRNVVAEALKKDDGILFRGILNGVAIDPSLTTQMVISFNDYSSGLKSGDLQITLSPEVLYTEEFLGPLLTLRITGKYSAETVNEAPVEFSDGTESCSLTVETFNGLFELGLTINLVKLRDQSDLQNAVSISYNRFYLPGAEDNDVKIHNSFNGNSSEVSWKNTVSELAPEIRIAPDIDFAAATPLPYITMFGSQRLISSLNGKSNNDSFEKTAIEKTDNEITVGIKMTGYKYSTSREISEYLESIGINDLPGISPVKTSDGDATITFIGSFNESGTFTADSYRISSENINVSLCKTENEIDEVLDNTNLSFEVHGDFSREPEITLADTDETTFKIVFSNGSSGEIYWLDGAVFDEIKVKDNPVDLTSMQWLSVSPAESGEAQ